MIIALSGAAGSGKTTIAQVLVRDYGFVRVRFAGPMKSMLMAIGLTEAQVDGPEKETPCDLLCGKTPRFALQRLGTEFGREMIGEDLWVNVAMKQIEAFVVRGQNVVIDDLRFDNEARALSRRLAYIFRVERGEVDADLRASKAHVSEAGISPEYILAPVLNDSAPRDAAIRVIELAGGLRD